MKRRRQQELLVALALAAAPTLDAFTSHNPTVRVDYSSSWRQLEVALQAKKPSKTNSVDDSSPPDRLKDSIRRIFFSEEEEPRPEEPEDKGFIAFARGLFRRKPSDDDKDPKNQQKKRQQGSRKVGNEAQQELLAKQREKQRQLQATKQQQKPQASRGTTKKGSDSGTAPVARALLGRSKEDSKQQKNQSESSDSASSNNPISAAQKFFSKEDSKQQQQKQSQSSDSASSNNPISTAQKFFSKEDSKQQQQKQSQSSDSASSNNPISAAQKFFANALANAGKKDDEQWVPVLSKTRLSPGEIVPATVGGIDIIIVASKDGRKLYCMANSCPHLGTPLETGQLVRLPMVVDTEPTSTTTAFFDKDPAAARSGPTIFTEMEVTRFLQQDGCEDCIVCPLHRTAFALESGQVRGEWCPYPPVLGNIVGRIKSPTPAAVFGIRTRGKNIEVRINTPLDTTTAAATPTSAGGGSNRDTNKKPL